MSKRGNGKKTRNIKLREFFSSLHIEEGKVTAGELFDAFTKIPDIAVYIEAGIEQEMKSIRVDEKWTPIVFQKLSDALYRDEIEAIEASDYDKVKLFEGVSNRALHYLKHHNLAGMIGEYKRIARGNKSNDFNFLMNYLQKDLNKRKEKYSIRQ